MQRDEEAKAGDNTPIPWSKRKGGFTACKFVFGKNITLTIYNFLNVLLYYIYALISRYEKCPYYPTKLFHFLPFL
jgi:hypothetical protein